MEGSVRIAIVEDQPAYLRSLVEALHARLGWAVVAQCMNPAQALREIPVARPDLILLDLLLPGASGIDLIPRLKAGLPDVPIVALTVEDRPAEIVRAIQTGASGYLIKDDGHDLLAGIEDVLAGRAAVMSPGVARRLWEVASVPAPPTGKPAALTEREWEVLRLAASGRQRGEIAQALRISLDTVKHHFSNIYQKLNVHSLKEALVKLRGGRGLLD